jgi:hypothetical protein
VRGSYTHSANTTVRVAPVQVTYLNCAIQLIFVLITVVSVRVRGSYTHSANTTVRVAPVQVPYLNGAIQFRFVLITVVSVRVRGSYTHSANTTVRVAPVQVSLRANSVFVNQHQRRVRLLPRRPDPRSAP